MRARAFLLVLTVGGAVLLSGCSGGSEAGAPSPSPSPSASASPTRTPAPTATASPEPTPVGALVVLWYGQGGSEQYNAMVKEARSAQTMHEQGRAIIDFQHLSKALGDAEAYRQIPDAPTQEVWASALEHTRSGMASVLAASSLAASPLPEDEAREAEAWGWENVGKGLKELKDVDTRFRGFGVLPLKDPWVG
uniref:Lipoprotein n=1 Tax=Streptomyces sp. NBC_00049 TaxID=2903617 RepID=A0AAU2JN74_9ACTN